MSILPVIRVFEWDTDEIASPAGNRNIPGGSFAFKRIVSSGCSTFDPASPATTSGTLDFRTKFDLTGDSFASHLDSRPVAITFNLANSGVAISDMRLYLSDDSAFQGSSDQGLDRGFVQMAASGSNWFYDFRMPSGSAPRLPLTIPSDANIRRQDGAGGLAGQDDLNSSEFVYLNVILPLGTPFGTYGACGSGLLRLSLVYNFWPNDFLLEF